MSIFIARKKAKNIIDALMTHWVGNFGIVGAIMTYTGGEFNSDEMREVASICMCNFILQQERDHFKMAACVVVNPIMVGNFAFLFHSRQWVELPTL